MHIVDKTTPFRFDDNLILVCLHWEVFFTGGEEDIRRYSNHKIHDICVEMCVQRRPDGLLN